MAHIDRVNQVSAPHLLTEPLRVVPERERQHRHPSDGEDRRPLEDSIELHDSGGEDSPEPPQDGDVPDPESCGSEPEEGEDGLDLRV